MSYENIFFDFDGTICDTSDGVFNSFDYVCDYFGLPRLGLKIYKTLIGPPLIESFRGAFGFEEEKAKKAIEVYREYYTPKGLYEAHVYEGIPQLLSKLKEMNKKIFVASSKPELFVNQLLERFSLSKFFDFAGGSDMAETRVQKSEVIEYVLKETRITHKEKCILIGDRKYDVIGAKKAGIETIGALWGFGTREELESYGAIACASLPEDVLDLV